MTINNENKKIEETNEKDTKAINHLHELNRSLYSLFSIYNHDDEESIRELNSKEFKCFENIVENDELENFSSLEDLLEYIQNDINNKELKDNNVLKEEFGVIESCECGLLVDEIKKYIKQSQKKQYKKIAKRIATIYHSLSSQIYELSESIEALSDQLNKLIENSQSHQQKTSDINITKILDDMIVKSSTYGNNKDK